jgi:holo-[acyl-carrier protein] synthase
VRVLGFGSDITNIDRIAAVLARHGGRFERRVFTEIEIARAERRPLLRVGSYAKRWAAKEACAKALGTGFARGVFHRDMGVVNLPGGRPTMQLTGGAAARLAELAGRGGTEIWVSLSDDKPSALATVLIVGR